MTNFIINSLREEKPNFYSHYGGINEEMARGLQDRLSRVA